MLFRSRSLDPAFEAAEWECTIAPSSRGTGVFIDAARLGPTRPAPIGRTRAAAWASAASLGPVFCEGRGLPEPRATRGIELLLEAFVLPFQPITFALDLAAPLFRVRQVLAQLRDLTLLALDQILGIIARRALVRHTCVMPYPRNLYKSNFLDSARLHGPTR